MIKYTHTNINTPNWEKLSKFYETVFDMKFVPPLRDLYGEWYNRLTGIDNARVKGCHMLLPGYGEEGPTIEFFTWENPDGTPSNKLNGQGMGHLAFAVENVEAKVQQLLDNGGTVYGPVVKQYYPLKGQTLTACFAKDPDGNAIEIQRWDDGDITK